MPNKREDCGGDAERARCRHNWKIYIYPLNKCRNVHCESRRFHMWYSEAQVNSLQAALIVVPRSRFWQWGIHEWIVHPFLSHSRYMFSRTCCMFSRFRPRNVNEHESKTLSDTTWMNHIPKYTKIHLHRSIRQRTIFVLLFSISPYLIVKCCLGHRFPVALDALANLQNKIYQSHSCKIRQFFEFGHLWIYLTPEMKCLIESRRSYRSNRK